MAQQKVWEGETEALRAIAVPRPFEHIHSLYSPVHGVILSSDTFAYPLALCLNACVLGKEGGSHVITTVLTGILH